MGNADRPEPVGAILRRAAGVTRPADETPLTPDELVRACQFLFGIADATDAQGGTTVVLPTRTVRRIGHAILGALNA